MKKVYILLYAILMILLAGCSNNTGTAGRTSDFDKLKSELSLIPKEYNTDNAVKDGSFVILHGVVKSKPEIMDKFVYDSHNGKSTSITIVQYTIEADPIITKTVYDGTKYYGIEDNTRDEFGSPQYRQFEFKYLKVFEENDIITCCLFNDNKITYSEFTKSMLSSNSKDWIDHQYLCNYRNKQ